MSETAAAIEPDAVRPVVATGGSGKLGLIAFVVALLIGGAWIVSLMSEQRAAFENKGAIAFAPDPTARIISPPPLSLPQDYYGEDLYAPRRPLPPVMLREIAAPAPQNVSQVSSPRSNAEVREQAALPAYAPPVALPPVAPAVTYGAPPQLPSQTAGTTAAKDDERVSAGRFENPSRTVPQGTVIPAVLETALDSTRPGGVRALVQRDIHSFDGTRVLIQRGSRLYGEYDAELKRGENRALIRWTRLIRPDGVTIALDSPASDLLGRAGVKGKVDGKFFQRFGSALLQSVLDIGVGVATREATDGVIVALPGSTQNLAPRVSEGEIRPTLTVRHGTSVSVFVARDLDFSSVEP